MSAWVGLEQEERHELMHVMHRLRPSLRDQSDPPGLREQVVVLFDEWARLSEDQPANQMHDKFVLKLQTAGFLKVYTLCKTDQIHAGSAIPPSMLACYYQLSLTICYLRT